MESHTSVIEFRSLKKTLRYGAKVKTGCRTCKLRRVRCDEGRPSCQKCTSAGRECAGYTQTKTLVKPKQPGPLRLKNALSMLPVAADGIEGLDFYHHCAAKAMSSRCDSNFWQRLAPQMAQTEPAIRHALIALGCLNRSETGSLKHATSLGDDRRGQVFLHYNKSLRHLVQRMNDVSYTPEIGLVACLLFVCIEFLGANYLAGFTHLYSGLKVISEWYRPLTIGEVPSQKPIPSFSVITQTAFDSATAMSDIVPMFFRAIFSSLMMGQEVEKILGTPVSTLRFFETPFRSIYDARIAALEIQNAALVFERDTAPRSFPPPKVTAKSLRLQSKILESHRSWWRAFEQLKHSTSLTPEEKLIESELKACNLTTYIATACATSIVQLIYDEHLDSFREIVRHVTILLDSMGLPKSPPPSPLKPVVPNTINRLHKPTFSLPQKAAANFTFDIGPLVSLWFTLLRCRCPITRRAALAQMERGAPREALWDSEHFALIAHRVIEIEEEKVDGGTGWPAEESRLWCAVPDGAIDRQGGFWVHFAKASWVLEGAVKYEELTGGVEEEEYPGWRKRGDNQWQEHFVL